MGDWITPCAIGPRAIASLDLPDGVYAYKLKVDGAWALDPANPRTRAVDGYRNSVLVVGGAPEPLLFAPAPPFVHEVEGGGLAVTAALRRGSGEALTVCWSEGDPAPAAAPGTLPPHPVERRTPMALAVEEDEHLLFHARLPASVSRVHLRFERPSPSGAGPEALAGPFACARLPSAEQPPAWWRDALVYTVLVDRFRPASDRADWGHHPGTAAAGGHLEGIRRSLGELCDLGVTVLYLTPIHVAKSSHRYDLIDPLRVDPALGGDEALARLLDAARAHGVRVLLDLSFSHAGRGFPPYEDVIARGRASPHAAWFQWLDRDPPTLKHYGTRTEAPLFDLAHPEVQDLVVRAAERWAQAGVDGFRLDSAAEVPIDLARRVRRRLRELRPGAIVLGELVPAHAWRWRAAGAVDAATDFGFHAVATDWLARRAIDAAAARRRLAALELTRGAPAPAALRFLSTHDHPRFASLARAAGDGAPARIALALTLLFTSPGVPALLYGEEIGLSTPTPELEPENVWPDRMPMPWRAGGRDETLRALVRRLAAARRASPALRAGDLALVHAEGQLLVFRRAGGGEIVDVALNAGGEPVQASLQDEDLAGLELIVAAGEAEVDGETVTLGAYAGAVLRRTPGGAGARRRRIEVAGNAAARDADFGCNALTTRARPTRIDFALTERCNLRCRHCITFAPQRTASGAARSLPPFLLDRLRGPFAFAGYYGFVHGGEPLVAPGLFDVLQAIRAARGGAPAIVHLLTNGVLLTARMTRRLIDAGVRSISVSLDGATAETNDAIRDGGSFEAIVANLRAAAAVRREVGADLRLGVSMVVLRENVGELEALSALAAEVGVDWIKLEEAVPVNAFAARSLVRPGAAPARDAVGRALRRARELGLVAVDHTAAPAIWRCKLEEQPEVAAFLRDDEFANRSEIHPCRGPWEHACVEPNGDVKVGDFFGPVLGNLGEASLDALWNSAAARAARVNAQALRLCGSGPVRCVAAARGPV